MELELGLKITKTRDDLTSTTKFRMAKDSSGPIFMSRETESKFILTAHLKGFGREHIRIKINEDGTEIAITWEKPVQEMVMSGWMMHKKEVELKGFIRVFRIPAGVVLDPITANFNEQESVLTILMPKSVKGIRGVGIEEVKEEEEEEEEVAATERNDEIGSTNEVPKSVGKVEESGQILQKKEGDKEKSEKETSAHKQAKEKEIVNGDKVKEQKIKTRHENRGSPGESSKKGAPNKGEEEPKNIANKEGSDSIDKEKVDEEKLKRTQEVTNKPPQEEKVSTAQKEEVDQTTKQTYNMEASTKPERKEAEMKVQIKSQEIREEDNNAFGTLERSDTKEGIMELEGEVLKELEAIAWSKKSQPGKEDHHEYEEARDGEENPEKEDEVQEEEPKEDPDEEKEENEHNSPHVEEKNDTTGEVSQGKNKPSSRKIKLCTPCVIAGSAIIASLVVFAIHWIRSKKKEVR